MQPETQKVKKSRSNIGDPLPTLIHSYKLMEYGSLILLLSISPENSAKNAYPLLRIYRSFHLLNSHIYLFFQETTATPSSKENLYFFKPMTGGVRNKLMLMQFQRSRTKQVAYFKSSSRLANIKLFCLHKVAR